MPFAKAAVVHFSSFENYTTPVQIPGMSGCFAMRGGRLCPHSIGPSSTHQPMKQSKPRNTTRNG
jgi:hypothetical protein